MNSGEKQMETSLGNTREKLSRSNRKNDSVDTVDVHSSNGKRKREVSRSFQNDSDRPIESTDKKHTIRTYSQDADVITE